MQGTSLKELKQHETIHTRSQPQAPSFKRHETDTIKKQDKNMNEKQLKRIADAIEEILRLVKKDMEPEKKK